MTNAETAYRLLTMMHLTLFGSLNSMLKMGKRICWKTDTEPIYWYSG